MNSDLPNGWTYEQVRILARIVAATYRWGGTNAGGWDAAYAAAYDGIIAHLFNTDRNPSRGELYVVAARNIRRTIAAMLRDTGTPIGPGNGARFHAYWSGFRQGQPDHAPATTDHLALEQVFDGLDAEDQETLGLLAKHLDGKKVREETGWGGAQYDRRVKKARANFLALWFEGERPPAIPRRVVVTIPTHNPGSYTERGYVYPKENKKGTKYRARYRNDGRVRELGIYADEAAAWAAVDKERERLAALRVLDSFEADHRQEQPAAQQSVRAGMGDGPVPCMA